MPTKEELLNELTIKHSDNCAKENRIRLVKEGLLWDSTASTKEDIVGILVESPKITKEKISAMLKPVGSATKTKVPEKERKIEEEHIVAIFPSLYHWKRK